MQLSLLSTKIRFDPVLMDVNAIMFNLRLAAETIYQMADTGELRWVWDVSLHAPQIRRRPQMEGTAGYASPSPGGEGRGEGGISRQPRNLRFWRRELIEPAVRQWPADQVIETVVGRSRETFLRAGRVKDILFMRQPSVWYLYAAGQLDGSVIKHTLWITRAALVTFLKTRLIQ